MALGSTATAQVKHWEHNFYISGGVSNKFEDGDDDHVALHLGYGLNYYFNQHWSVMPGIGLRTKFSFGDPDDGADSHGCTFLDIPVLAQYHLNGQANGLVFELGPVFSFITDNDRYYIDAYYNDYNDPLNGKKEYKNFDLGIRPGVYYQAGHWRFGVQSYIGLLNIKKNYAYRISNISGSYHFTDIAATVGFHF